jgi:hypothetical protein
MLAERTRLRAVVVGMVGVAGVCALVVKNARPHVVEDAPIIAIPLPADPVDVRIEMREHTDLVMGPRLQAYEDWEFEKRGYTCALTFTPQIMTDADRAWELARRESRKRELLEDRPWAVKVGLSRYKHSR